MASVESGATRAHAKSKVGTSGGKKGGKAAASRAAAAEAAEATEATETLRSPGADSQTSQSATEGAQGAAANAQVASPEGGGAAAARVRPAGRKSYITFAPPDAASSGRTTIERIALGKGEGATVMNKPTPDDPDGTWTKEQVRMLWMFFEQAHKKCKRVEEKASRFDRMEAICSGRDRQGSKRAHDDLDEDSASGDEADAEPVETKKRKPKRAKGMPVEICSGLPILDWRPRPLPGTLEADIGARYFLAFKDTTTDKHGQPYDVPDGEWGSNVGKFPHAILSNARNRSAAASSDPTTYACDYNHNLTIEVQLMRRLADGSTEPTTEAALLKELNGAFDMQERANWGTHESKIMIDLRMEFAPPSNCAWTDLRINPNPRSEHCAFKRPVPHGKVLCPPESKDAYAPNSTYQKEMDTGRVVFSGFKINEHVSSTNHTDTYKGFKYNMVARVANPFLVNIPSFTIRSVPFKCQAALQNKIKANLRWVRTESGEIVHSPREDMR